MKKVMLKSIVGIIIFIVSVFGLLSKVNALYKLTMTLKEYNDIMETKPFYNPFDPIGTIESGGWNAVNSLNYYVAPGNYTRCYYENSDLGNFYIAVTAGPDVNRFFIIGAVNIIRENESTVMGSAGRDKVLVYPESLLHLTNDEYRSVCPEVRVAYAKDNISNGQMIIYGDMNTANEFLNTYLSENGLSSSNFKMVTLYSKTPPEGDLETLSGKVANYPIKSISEYVMKCNYSAPYYLNSADSYPVNMVRSKGQYFFVDLIETQGLFGGGFVDFSLYHDSWVLSPGYFFEKGYTKCRPIFLADYDNFLGLETFDKEFWSGNYRGGASWDGFVMEAIGDRMETLVVENGYPDPPNYVYNPNADVPDDSSGAPAPDYNFCSREGVIKTLSWVNAALSIIKIIVPGILILLGSIDFSKAVVTSNEDSIKEASKKFGLRVLIGVVIFFIPTIVLAFLNLLVNFKAIDEKNKACFNCVFHGDCISSIPDYQQ